MADGRVRHVGLRKARGLVCGTVHFHLHRALPVHANSDSRRDHHGLPWRSPCGLFSERSTSEKRRPRIWALILAASMAVSLMLKSLIGVVFPAGAGPLSPVIHTPALCSKDLEAAASGQRRGIDPADYRAVSTFWAPRCGIRRISILRWIALRASITGFYGSSLANEQVPRFLNLRFPRDYNTVLRVYFWLLHSVWLRPWSVYFPAIAAFLHPVRSRRKDPLAGTLLDGLRADFLHVFDHPGILFDAVLSGAGAAARLRHGRRRR